MLLRVLFILFCLILCAPSAQAAACLDVFPSGWRENTPANEQLINFPSNFSGATLTDGTTLPRGDNLYNNSNLGNKGEVYVSGLSGSETTARLFFRSSVSWQNVKINENGDPEDLIIVIDGGLQITGGSTVINAIIYVKGTTSVNGNSTINGAAATVGSSDLFNVNYDESYITNADFNGMCDNTPVIPAQVLVNYRFDECSYTGINGDVIDQMGNYSGQSFGNVNTNTDGQIERFTDISNADHHIETSVPVPTNFSVSTWFKKPTSTSGNPAFVLGAMQGGGDLLYIDRDDDWKWGVYNNSGSTSGDYSFNDLDNNWHHLTLVYSAGQTQLYIDGGLQETLARAPSGTLKYIGTSFDQINDVDPQGFRAPLDEFLVYDEALTAANISVIYNNQLAKKNYDGSIRDAVNCNSIELVAGRVTLNNTADDPTFTHVCFDEPFSVVPVVFSLPTTASNADRLALRIRNVTVNGFDIAQVESPEKSDPNQPAGNLPQTVDFLAIVEGDYDLDGGAKMRVSSIATKIFQGRSLGNNGKGWETVSTADLGFAQSPAIIASIQTMSNEPNNSNLSGPFPYSEPFLATTIRSVNNNSFQIALERGETNSGTITNNETIGYIAITPGFDGQLTNDITYESFRSDNNVRGINTCRVVGLNNYTGNPLIIASQNTRAGTDGGWLKRCSISTSTVGFSIVEDGDRDMDTNHINERAGGLALGGIFKDFTNSCTGPIIDHYQIEHNGSGLTCAPETVTIRACTNDVCSPLSNVSVSLDFQTDGVTQEALSFVGSTTISLSQTTADTLTLGIINESISAISPTVCVGGNPNLCDIVFADTGFRFFENLETNPIPTQISAKPSNTLKIQAIEKNPDTGACQASFIDTTTIEMAATCVDPIACAGSQVAINNLTTTGDITTLDKNSALSYSPVNLDFSNDTVNSAEFILTYPDAGKIQLHARYNLPDENGDPSGNYMLGTSNQFVVRPFGFYINVADNPKAETAAGAKFIAAGDEFSTVLKAVQWQVDNDTNLSDNQITKNFGNEQVPETAKISPNMVLPNLLTSPNPGVLGSLTNVTFDTFSAGSNAEQGIATNDDMTYSEVGIISFSANLTDNSYLGADDVVGSEPYVGRFIPDHFVQIIEDDNQGSLTANHDNNHPLTCNMLDWVYTGQLTNNEGTIRYLIEPVLTITAKNSDGVKTVNYIGDFAKLLNVDNETVTSKNKITFTGPSTAGLPLIGNVNGTGVIANESGGVLTYQLPEQHHFVYIRNSASEVSPFNADFELPFSEFIDSDDVTFKPSNGGTDYFQNPHFYQLDAIPPDVSDFDNTVEVRFGRWLLENSYGPETSQLPVTMVIQHFDGSSFITNDKESCLVPTVGDKEIPSGAIGDAGLNLWDYRLVDNISDDSLSPSDTDASFADENESFVSGLYRWLLFSAPGASNVGSLELEYQVPPWLQYDWNDDESFTNNPTSTLTFGLFRGNDRIIYQREILR